MSTNCTTEAALVFNIKFERPDESVSITIWIGRINAARPLLAAFQRVPPVRSSSISAPATIWRHPLRTEKKRLVSMTDQPFTTLQLLGTRRPFPYYAAFVVSPVAASIRLTRARLVAAADLSLLFFSSGSSSASIPTPPMKRTRDSSRSVPVASSVSG